MSEDKNTEIVKEELTRYLEAKGHRKTPERYTILETIYSLNRHFDIDLLYDIMSSSCYRVSKATIYNTIDLFLDANLVRKHQFGNHPAQYEKTYNTINHHHLVCTACGEIQEVKDPETCAVISNKKFNKFTTSYYTLYVYGICSKCSKRKKKGSTSKKVGTKTNLKNE